MASVVAMVATETFLRIIHISGEFSLPMNSEAWD